MSRPLILFSLLILHIFCAELQAAIPAPFPCELKSSVQVDKLDPALKQWLFLFDLASMPNPLEISVESIDASFESNYWQSFREVKKLVQNCDQMIAFWQNFGESIEQFFDEIEPVGVDAAAISQTVLAFEMQKRGKFKPVSKEYSLTIILEPIEAPIIKPWWSVRTRSVVYVRVFEVPFSLYQERGPLGALFSYEILRKWQKDFPYDFWLDNHILPKERSRILSFTFPWAKSILYLLEILPPRHKSTTYLNYILIIVAAGFGLRLFWALYCDFSQKK